MRFSKATIDRDQGTYGGGGGGDGDGDGWLENEWLEAAGRGWLGSQPLAKNSILAGTIIYI